MLNSDTVLQPAIKKDATYSYDIKDDDTSVKTEEIDNEESDSDGCLSSENPLNSRDQFGMINNLLNSNISDLEQSYNSERQPSLNQQMITGNDEIENSEIKNNISNTMDMDCEMKESKNAVCSETLDTNVRKMKGCYFINVPKSTGDQSSLLKQSNYLNKCLYSVKIGKDKTGSSKVIPVSNDNKISDTTKDLTTSSKSSEEAVNENASNQTNSKNRLISDVFLKTVIFDESFDDIRQGSPIGTNYNENSSEASEIYTSKEESNDAYLPQINSYNAIIPRQVSEEVHSHPYPSNIHSYEQCIENFDFSQEVKNDASVSLVSGDVNCTQENPNEVISLVAEEISDNIEVIKNEVVNLEKQGNILEVDGRHEIWENDYSEIESVDLTSPLEGELDIESEKGDDDTVIFDIASDTATDDIDIVGLRSGKIKLATGTHARNVKDSRVFKYDPFICPNNKESAFKPGIPYSKTSRNRQRRCTIIKKIIKDESLKHKNRSAYYRNLYNLPLKNVLAETAFKDFGRDATDLCNLHENVSKRTSEFLDVHEKSKKIKKAVKSVKDTNCHREKTIISFPIDKVMKPELEKSNKVMKPELDKSNKVMKPELDKSNKIMKPEFDKSNKIMKPELDKSNKIMKPELDKSNKVMKPELDKSNKDMKPELDKSNNVPTESEDEIIDVCTNSIDDTHDRKGWTDKILEKSYLFKYNSTWNNVYYELHSTGHCTSSHKLVHPERINFNIGNKKLKKYNYTDAHSCAIMDNINDAINENHWSTHVSSSEVVTTESNSLAFLKKIMKQSFPREVISMLCFFFMHEPGPSVLEIRKLSKAVGRSHKLLQNWFMEAKLQCASKGVKFRRRKLFFCSYCLGSITATNIEHLLDKKHLKSVLGRFYVEDLSEDERLRFWSTEMKLLKDQNAAEIENESVCSDSSRPVTPLEDMTKTVVHTVIDHSKPAEEDNDKTNLKLETTSDEATINSLVTDIPKHRQFEDLLVEMNLINKTLNEGFPTSTTVRKAYNLLCELGKFSRSHIKSLKTLESYKAIEQLLGNDPDVDIKESISKLDANVTSSNMSKNLKSEEQITFSQTFDNKTKDNILMKIENYLKQMQSRNDESEGCAQNTEVEKKLVKIGDTLFQCPCCLKIFQTEWNLLKHSLIHKSFKCKHCPEHFPNEETLQSHLLSHFNPSLTDGKSVEMTPCKECHSGVCSCVQYRELLEPNEFNEEIMPCFVDNDSSVGLHDRFKVSWEDVSSQYFNNNKLSKRKTSLKSIKLFRKPHVKKSGILPSNGVAKNQPKARESDLEHKSMKDSVEEITDANMKQCYICEEAFGSRTELTEHMFLHKIKSRNRGSVETVDFLAVPGKKRKIPETESDLKPKPKKPHLKPEKPNIQMKCFYCHRLICNERFLRVHIKNHCKLAPQANIKELLKPNKTLIDLAKEGYGKLYYWFNVETSEIIDTIDLKMNELNAPKPVGKMISRCKFCGMNFERVREVRKHLQKTCHKITKASKKRLKEGATLDAINAVELVNYELMRKLDLHLNQEGNDMDAADYAEPMSDTSYSEANQSSYDGNCKDFDHETSNDANFYHKEIEKNKEIKKMTKFEKRKKAYDAIIDKVISNVTSIDADGGCDLTNGLEESLVSDDRYTPDEFRSDAEFPINDLSNLSEISNNSDNGNEMCSSEELTFSKEINPRVSLSNEDTNGHAPSSQSSQMLNIVSDSDSHNFSGFEDDLKNGDANASKSTNHSTSEIIELDEDRVNISQNETQGNYSSDLARIPRNQVNVNTDVICNTDYEKSSDYINSFDNVPPIYDNSIDIKDKMQCEQSTENPLNRTVEDLTGDFQISNVVSVTETCFNKSVLDTSRNIEEDDYINNENTSQRESVVSSVASTQEIINLDSDNELEEDKPCDVSESSESDVGEMLLDMDDMNLENAFETVAVNDENINETE